MNIFSTIFIDIAFFPMQFPYTKISIYYKRIFFPFSFNSIQNSSILFRIVVLKHYIIYNLRSPALCVSIFSTLNISLPFMLTNFILKINLDDKTTISFPQWLSLRKRRMESERKRERTGKERVEKDAPRSFYCKWAKTAVPSLK